MKESLQYLDCLWLLDRLVLYAKVFEGFADFFLESDIVSALLPAYFLVFEPLRRKNIRS